jgi:RimJ/RimL family protein N-acetyltransferase
VLTDLPPELSRPLTFWSGFLGVAPEVFFDPGRVLVVRHAELGGYYGAWIFEHAGVRVISLLPEVIAQVEPRAEATARLQLGDPELVRALFAGSIERVIGPAYHGYLDPTNFRPFALGEVRPVTREDQADVDRLRDACGETAWSYAGIAPERPTPRYGVWLQGRLAAIAQNEAPIPGAVSPGVVTHPYFRGRGCGKAAVSAAVADALERDELVLYQTLMSNDPALGVAAALGFEPFGCHIAVRFLRGSTPGTWHP